MSKQKKTISIDEVKNPFTCRFHNLTVKRTLRKSAGSSSSDEERVGIYYGCPKYFECGYYIDGALKNVVVTNDEGIALGHAERNED